MLLCGLPAALILTGCPSSSRRIENKPVVSIGDNELSSKDFAHQMASKLKYFDAILAKNPVNVSRVKREIIQNFVHVVVLENWAKANSVVVSEEEINEAVLAVRKNYPDDLAFKQALAQQNRELSELRLDLKKTLLEKKLFAHLSKGIEDPSDQEMELYFKANESLFKQPAQIKVRQILLSREEDAEALQKNLVKVSFEDLAKQFSIAPEGKSGGLVGWVDKGSFDVFDKAAEKKSKISTIKSQFGFHIVEVLDRRPESTKTFKESKDLIKRALLAEREQALYVNWLEQQTKNLKVSKDEKLIDSITVETKRE